MKIWHLRQFALFVASLAALSVSSCKPPDDPRTSAPAAWEENREQMKSVAKELVRVEIVVIAQKDRGYQRVGPICVLPGENLEKIRKQLLELKNVGPDDGAKYSTMDRFTMTLITDDLYEYQTRAIDSSIFHFFADGKTIADLDYEFGKFVDELAAEHALNHPEDVVRYGDLKR